MREWFADMYRVCTPLSYVDDIQLLVNAPRALPAMRSALNDFAASVDLILDPRKSYAWSSTVEGRNFLKTQGVRVEQSAKALGAHMQYGARHTNSNLVLRLAGLSDLWERLRFSPCPYAYKARALRACAWPKGLHGSAATQISSQLIHNARSGAMKGLNADGSGCNPWIQLGLIEPSVTDPGFWMILDTFRACRQCSQPEAVLPLLVEMVSDPALITSTGLVATLLVRLQTLSWTVCPDGRIADSFGPFSFHEVSFPELAVRAEWSWYQVVAQAVHQRPGFQSLRLADVPSTRAWLKMLPNKESAAFRKVLNGAIFTNDSASHWQVDSTPTCPYCMCSDSRYHRFWLCEVFQDVRGRMDPQVFAMVPQLPESLTCFGWSLRPNVWREWTQALIDLEPGSIAADVSLPGDRWVDVFTDGSCQWPTETWRLASYAVVFAPMSGLAHMHRSQVLAAGHVPGILQSAYRAELWGVLAALNWACARRRKVRIWSDCSGVVLGLRNMLHYGYRGSVNGKHSDLWRAIARAVSNLGADNIVITKVASHLDPGEAPTELESWCFCFNGVVDRAAEATNLTRHPAFWDLFRRFVHSAKTVERVNREVQRCQLAVSMAVLRQTVEPEMDFQGEAKPDATASAPAQGWVPFPDVAQQPPKAIQKYGQRLVQLFKQWFWYGVSLASEPPRWVSFYQLYIDYSCSTGDSGPVRFDGVWQDPNDNPDFDLIQFHFKQRVNWWARLVREVVLEMGGAINMCYTRPESVLLNLHTSCCWIPWQTSRLDLIESWLLKHHKGTASRNGKTLEQ